MGRIRALQASQSPADSTGACLVQVAHPQCLYTGTGISLYGADMAKEQIPAATPYTCCYLCAVRRAAAAAAGDAGPAHAPRWLLSPTSPCWLPHPRCRSRNDASRLSGMPA